MIQFLLPVKFGEFIQKMKAQSPLLMNCVILSPWSNDGGNNRKMTGLYLYDEEHYRWYLPADKIEELKKEMKEYGVDA